MTWIHIGQNQWIRASDAMLNGESRSQHYIVTVSNAAGATLYANDGTVVSGRILSAGTKWKTNLFKVTNGILYYNVGTNLWVKANDIGIFNSIRTSGVIVGSVMLYNGFGSNASPSRMLGDNTSWQIFGQVTDSDGHSWYNLGSNQYVRADAIVTEGQHINRAVPLDHSVATVNGDQGAMLYDAPGGSPTYRVLSTNTRWKVADIAASRDGLWYLVGGHEWISALSVHFDD
ncbi:SLAP domain-containing protein [Schleiferilactobacillus shenzhenensis]|uniref:SLAP domain-containing protein n=1 Tax=Schleiferilactobacillus shenzhenensis TaxID=1231337 RepID=UPI00058F904B